MSTINLARFRKAALAAADHADCLAAALDNRRHPPPPAAEIAKLRSAFNAAVGELRSAMDGTQQT